MSYEMSNTTEYKRFEERPETQLLLDKIYSIIILMIILIKMK